MTTGNRTIRLPRSIVNRILERAQASPDEEVCGLLGTRGGRITTDYPVDNVAGDPSHRYVMDPAGQIAAMRTMRERGETLFAIYHSHPSGPASPSATDVAEANYPDAVYLIVSLDTRGVLELRAYRLDRDGAEEYPLDLVP